MKAQKIIRTIVIVVFVLIVVLAAGFYFYGNQAIKIGVEKGASHALKVAVAVDDVNVSLLAGEVGLENLAVDNPEGYQLKKLLQLGNGQVKLNLGSLLSPEIKIEDILLENVNVTLEQKGLSNNIQDVINNITPPAEEKPQGEKPAPGKKLRIKKLQINNVNVQVKLLPVPGQTDALTLKLAPITMEDLGTDDKLDIAMLSSKILIAIADGIVQQGSAVLPKEITGPLGDNLKRLGSLSKDVLEQTTKIVETGAKGGKEATEKIIKDTQNVGEGIKKGLDDILKPKDKEEKKD